MNGQPPGPPYPGSNAGAGIKHDGSLPGPSLAPGYSHFVQDYYTTVTGQPTHPSVSRSAGPSDAVGTSSQAYYSSNYPGTVWPYPWTGTQYPGFSNTHHPPQPPQFHVPPVHAPSPSPSPPPPIFHPHWDAALKAFLVRVGLTQTLRGFELDMLVMNSDWERSQIPGALHDFVKNISKLGEVNDRHDAKPSSTDQRPLEDRKLDYVQFAKGVEPQSQTSLNRSISKFLAQNRARNDASNRAEFLYSPAQKRRRIDEGVATLTNESSAGDSETWSCARTDAKPIDRDVQMRYDIAKNEDGPLRRTVKNTDPVGTGNAVKDQEKGNKPRQSVDSEKDADDLTSIRHPGLDERITNIEAHLSVRYVPSPPRTLLDRLKFLEEHIVRLEKDYPPWAALHFNQPKRGWPPPPRSMPIIVPPSLRTAGGESASTDTAAIDTAAPSTSTPVIGKWRNNKSSLHRAVMEKLEVQKAMTDLAGDAQ